MSNEEKFEREGLLASLGVRRPTPDGDEYAGRFLGRSEGCPRLADQIRLVKGEADETTRARLLAHFEECAPCRTWHESYASGWQERQRQEAGAEDSLAAATSRGLKANRPAPLPLPALEPSRWTGICTSFERGDVERGARDLEPYLPGILEAVKMSPALAPSLLVFIKDRRPRRLNLPALLREFAQEVLSRAFEELTFLPSREVVDDVVARGYLRTWLAQGKGEEAPEVTRLRQEAQQRGVKSFADLRRLTRQLGLHNDAATLSFLSETTIALEVKQRQIREVCGCN